MWKWQGWCGLGNWHTQLSQIPNVIICSWRRACRPWRSLPEVCPLLLCPLQVTVCTGVDWCGLDPKSVCAQCVQAGMQLWAAAALPSVSLLPGKIKQIMALLCSLVSRPDLISGSLGAMRESAEEILQFPERSSSQGPPSFSNGLQAML